MHVLVSEDVATLVDRVNDAVVAGHRFVRVTLLKGERAQALDVAVVAAMVEVESVDA